MTDLQTYRCRATVAGERCETRGTRDQLAEHANEVGHDTCVLCGITLNEWEVQTCSVRTGKETRATCVERLDTTLADILDAYATLPSIVEHSGYHAGQLPGGNALVLIVDGSVTGGGPDDDVHYHDPVPVLPQLYEIERRWAEDLRYPREPRSDATVSSTVAWLREWLPHAARHHDGIDLVADEIRELRSKLQHAAGLADDPESAPADCFECGGALRRHYRPLRVPVTERLQDAVRAAAADDDRISKHVTRQVHRHADDPAARKKLRISSRARRVRQAVAGDDREGLASTWTCSGCGLTYTAAQYSQALRMRANSITGWVTVRVAAETLRRPERTIWRWVEIGDVSSACSVMTRRVLVDWEQVKELSSVTQRRNRQEAS